MDVQGNERAKMGQRLKAARERAHVTVEEAARYAGVQPTAIRRWERGASLPALLEFRGLLAAYGTIACEVLYEDNPWRLPDHLALELRRASDQFSAALRSRIELYLTAHAQGVEPVFKKAPS